MTRQELAHFDSDIRSPVIGYPLLSTWAAGVEAEDRPLTAEKGTFFVLEDSENLQFVTLKQADIVGSSWCGLLPWLLSSDADLWWFKQMVEGHLRFFLEGTSLSGVERAGCLPRHPPSMVLCDVVLGQLSTQFTWGLISPDRDPSEASSWALSEPLNCCKW